MRGRIKERGREGDRRSRAARGLDSSQEERVAMAAGGGGRRWRGKKGLEVGFKIPTPFCTNARPPCGCLCANLENKKKGEKGEIKRKVKEEERKCSGRLLGSIRLTQL